MGRSAGRGYQLTGRGAMHSPGAPSLRHETERLFWKQIATGITSERAAEAVGVSQAVGSRWFRYRGGGWTATIILAGIATEVLAGGEKSEAA
jgi:hypothetical protein